MGLINDSFHPVILSYGRTTWRKTPRTAIDSTP